MIKNRNKWMAALLLMTFLCMAFAPGAVFADTTASADAVTDEEQAKAEEIVIVAKKENLNEDDVYSYFVDTLIDEVNNLVYFSVVFVVGVRVVVSLKLVDLGCSHTEDDDVVVSDSVMNFDVCTVHCAECDCTVEHKLHITCTACLSTCK